MVKSETIAAAAASLLLLPGVNGIYAKNSPVLQIDGRSYDTLIAKSNYTSIVEFYAPWCGHCKNLKPAYEKAAKSLAGLAKVAAVDCDDESNKPFCGSMGVQGFPTLKIVKPGKKPGKPIVEEYNGARSAKAIVDTVIDKIPNHVKRLKNSDYAGWTKEAGPKAILFSDKGTVSALLKSVAIEFLGGLEVAQIRDKETEAVEAFGVEKFPTLVLLPGDGKEPMIYDGELKKDGIVKFLSQVAAPNPDPAPKAKKEKSSSSNKSKASKSSSKFAEASASHASKEAQTDAASQTDEALENDPTESPDPKVQAEKPAKMPTDGLAKPITSLQDGLSLQQQCLNDKAGTCILCVLPEEETPSEKTIQAIRALSELHKKHEAAKRNLFPFYQLPGSNSQAAALRKKLDLSAGDVEIIAVNGKRSWWRHYTGGSFTLEKVEDWVDAIRMGDGKKSDIPSGIIAKKSELPEAQVRPETGDETPDLEALREQLKGQTPEGMEYVLEEITDEEYEKLMNQGGTGEPGTPLEEAKAPVEDHDEL
ncbi:related to disulfide isomerase [Lecanosticta acicola]|uniref:protein disulfide-isomerase n=1 Tax=Lecanosticta acicola TaxID=111012 RepID=A0AAI8Z3Y2_9PEZI|nr:related to disulfide isomerase [Lecanosticta acicola]